MHYIDYFIFNNEENTLKYNKNIFDSKNIVNTHLDGVNLAHWFALAPKSVI